MINSALSVEVSNVTEMQTDATHFMFSLIAFFRLFHYTCCLGISAPLPSFTQRYDYSLFLHVIGCMICPSKSHPNLHGFSAGLKIQLTHNKCIAWNPWPRAIFRCLPSSDKWLGGKPGHHTWHPSHFPISEGGGAWKREMCSWKAAIKKDYVKNITHLATLCGWVLSVLQMGRNRIKLRN